MNTSTTNRPISAARLAANRANARKSTGPRTPEGKAKVARNAIKHGLCSRDPLACGPARECKSHRAESYRSFVLELRDTIRPQGTAQEMLFEQLAPLAWQQRQVPHAERMALRIERRKVRGDGTKPLPRGALGTSALFARRFYAPDGALATMFDAVDRYEKHIARVLLGLMFRLSELKQRDMQRRNPQADEAQNDAVSFAKQSQEIGAQDVRNRSDNQRLRDTPESESKNKARASDAAGFYVRRSSGAT